MQRASRILAILILLLVCISGWFLSPDGIRQFVTNPLVLFLLTAFGIIPLVLLIENWRKLVNPIIGTVYNILTYNQRREYFPPKVSIEGFGIKRGLTLVEAAVVLEKPFDAILTMILANAVEKGAIRINLFPETVFSVERPLPKSLQAYERYLARACSEDHKDARQEILIECMVRLIKSTNTMMKGFDRAETIQFYQNSVDDTIVELDKSNLYSVAKELIGDLEDFTLKVTKITNPVPSAPIFAEVPEYLKTRSGNGGSGGYYRHLGGGGHSCACAGCACACACAGCACACAGGGR